MECVALLLSVSDPLAVGADGLDAAAMARKRGHMDMALMTEAFIESQALSTVMDRAHLSPSAKKKL